MAARPDKQFAGIATFAAVPLTEATKKYKLARFTEDIDFDDMFGEEPENVFVAKGTVKLAKLKLDTMQDAGVYIIDGDLVVEGAIDFTHQDGAAVLCVLGSVKAKSLTISDEAHLWVVKDLTLSGPLVNKLSDAGGLHVRGKTKSVEPKAAKPAKSKTKVHPAIAAVTQLEPITVDDADKRFGLHAILDVLQNEVPKAVYLHQGDVTVRGVIDVREAAPDGKDAAYIIAGDLDVDTLAIDARSMSTWGLLVVTGHVRAKRVACIFEGRLWVGKNLDVEEAMVASTRVHVAGDANIPLLVIRMMPPTFAKLPTIGALLDVEAGQLGDWASKWHDALPARLEQKTVLAAAYAESSIEQLTDALVAGATLR